MDISASVGAWERGAHNLKADVITVQTLLTGAARRLGRPVLDPQGIDGGIARPPKDSATVAAIKAFQLLSDLAPSGLQLATPEQGNDQCPSPHHRHSS